MLATLLGVGLLTLLFVDAFVTVLHASSGAGPYTSLQNRVVWRAARGGASRLPGRDRVLSLAAPAMALATPVAWIALLTGGFTLLYRPALPTFTAQPPLEVGPWSAALYYAGYVTSTLGIGDITPSGTLWRLATVAHSALGFALFSAAITYVISIYDRHTDDAALALHIHNLFREGPGPGIEEWSPDLAATLAARLSTVNVAHRQYPILHYFHGDEAVSLPVQVGRLIRYVEDAPPEVRSRAGGIRALERAVEDFMDQMPFDLGGRGDTADLTEKHRRLLAAHLYPR